MICASCPGRTAESVASFADRPVTDKLLPTTLGDHTRPSGPAMIEKVSPESKGGRAFHADLTKSRGTVVPRMTTFALGPPTSGAAYPPPEPTPTPPSGREPEAACFAPHAHMSPAGHGRWHRTAQTPVHRGRTRHRVTPRRCRRLPRAGSLRARCGARIRGPSATSRAAATPARPNAGHTRSHRGTPPHARCDGNAPPPPPTPRTSLNAWLR